MAIYIFKYINRWLYEPSGFDLLSCVQCLVGVICVPDSPSSVVNKQLGSMTLDEQQGASSSNTLLLAGSFSPSL